MLDPAGHPRDDVMLHAPLPAGEAKYGDLDGRHMKDVLQDFVAISRKNRESGEAFWGRNVGTAGHADAQNWVDAYFRKVGLQKIHRESFDLRPQWFASKGWSVRIWNPSFSV